MGLDSIVFGPWFGRLFASLMPAFIRGLALIWPFLGLGLAVFGVADTLVYKGIGFDLAVFGP